jgi:hypothetical protein
MHTSSFAVLALVALAAAFAMLLVTPHERHNASADARALYWMTQR